MAVQFDRQARVTIGVGELAIRIEELRISFNIEANRAGYPNTAKISIYNLAASSRQRIKNRGDKIQLEAGYPDNMGIIFRGDITNVFHTKSGSDIITTMELGDGDTDFNHATINKTLDVGSNAPIDVVRECASEFEDVALGNIDVLEGLPYPTRPTVLNGNVKDELDKIARKEGFAWSIQNGELEVVKNEQAIPDVVVISSETGLIGTPEVTESGVNAKALLNPRIRPNRTIQVLSDYIDDLDTGEFNKRDTELGAGFFRADKVVYQGDTEGAEFVCNIEARRIYDERVVG